MSDCNTCDRGFKPDKNGLHKLIHEMMSAPNEFVCPRLALLGAAVEAIVKEYQEHCARTIRTPDEHYSLCANTLGPIVRLVMGDSE